MSEKTVLSASHVDSGYGNLQIVQDVSFSIGERELLAVIGPNGSGKSTLLKTIFGLTDLHGGEISYRDKKISGLSPEAIAACSIAYVPQRENVFPNLSVNENLEIGGITISNKKEVRESINTALEIFPQLKEIRNKKAGLLSGGERQMLAISRALVQKPNLLLLDEPTAALSPQIVKLVISKIGSLRNQDITVVLVEQNANEALSICDKAIVLASGRKVFDGTAAEIGGNEQIMKFFLDAD